MDENILIIDDDPEILKMLATILVGENYRVFPAERGKEAIKMYQSNPIDLVITDISMPGMSGLEVLKAIKQIDIDMEVIVLTGIATFENAVQALKEDGAFNYLTKPLEDIEDLLITVKRAIEKRKLRFENKTLIEKLKKEVDVRKRVEKQLVLSKANLQSVFDGISEPLLMVDREMNIKMLNETAKNYTQLSRYQDILDKRCYEVLSGRTTMCENCKLPLAISSCNPVTFERKGLQNPERIEEVVIYPIYNKVKNEGKAIIRISDITEQKKIGEQLLRADRLASLGQLSGGIAHEIRNPLASISLFADVLCDQEKFDRSRQEVELFDDIKDNISRIEKIIKGVLDFAKPPVTSNAGIDMNQLTREIVKFWSSKLRKSKILLNLDLKDNLPPAQGDAIGLQQVINNVVLNAIEAMGEGGDINIKTSLGDSAKDASKNRVYLKVSDTGPGIPQDHQENIFNPFFTTKATGTGLGLSISHQIIKRQGGTFTFENNPDAGTTFIIELPVSDSKKENYYDPLVETRALAN